MIRNYLLIAWRSLLKNKLFSFINVFGLALSMSLCMVVMIHVLDTLRYDTFHPHKKRIFRVLSRIEAHDGRAWTLASTPLPLTETLAETEPLFESITSLYPAIDEEASYGEKAIPVNGAFTQPSFFKVFGFALMAGDPETALANPTGIVISQATAEKFFTTENPVGKILTLEKLGVFEVTGVLQTPATKSHINFDVYLSFSSIPVLEKERKLPPKLSSWDSFEHAYTYVLLGENTERHNLDERLAAISRDINKDAHSGTFTFRSQALSSITPTSDDIYNDIGRGTTWGKLMAEVGIGFIILLAACFNYTNLSIARALTRTREVGIRKVIGAKRRQIFFQYIIEAVLVAIVALLVAQIVLGFLVELNIFQEGSDIRFNLFTLSCFLGFTVFVGLLAGALPAWILSSFKAVKMLRNAVAEKIMGGLTLRKVLLVFQFSISLVILIFMTVFHRQFSYLADVDPGYRMNNIISIPFPGKSHDVLSTELSRIGGVENISASSGNFGRYATGTVSVSRVPDNRQPLKINYYFIDSGVIPVSDLTLMAGKNFGNESPGIERELILNQKAVEALGFENPVSAIGETIWIEDSVEVTLVGVVKDFYNEGTGNAFRPLALRNKAGSYNTLNLLITEAAAAAIVTNLEQVWKKVYPDRAFSYVWLRKQYDKRYADNGSVSVLGFLAFMAITIASLGLLGLVVYTVETRRKEISIRKIIGASIQQLIVLLSKGFARLLLIAGAIAMPVGYVLSELFLINFANRIHVGIGIPLACFSLLLSIGLSMILSQTYKASAENPARNLRSE